MCGDSFSTVRADFLSYLIIRTSGRWREFSWFRAYSIHIKICLLCHVVSEAPRTLHDEFKIMRAERLGVTELIPKL